jgi:16S rRNA (cytosine967-C5)-methyltransferase
VSPRPTGGREDEKPERPTTARSVALDVIRRVIDEGAYSNLALARTLARAGLSERDAALASELAYGTIRKKLPLDYALAPRLERPLETAPKEARALLRLGAYQLLFTRIPEHAAVSETVELAGPRHRGFVNAVLRRLAREGVRWPDGDGDEDVAIRTGLATWAVRELRLLFGNDAEAAARALGEHGPRTLRTNTCRKTVDGLERALRDAGIDAERGTLHEESLSVSAGAPTSLPGFAEGWFAVQDQASSFVVRTLEPQPGERVLDVCAGPGGKAAHIACLIGPQGQLVASDPSPARAGLVRSTLDRLGVRGHVVAQDARHPALRGPFDRILVDAPCSGIGAARRRPELLWRVQRDDLSTLARLQVAIVAGVADLLRPGGFLVYSVCTFPRAETDAACDAIVRHRAELERVDLPGPEGPSPRFRLWPHVHGCDAMFVAGFRRRETGPG